MKVLSKEYLEMHNACKGGIDFMMAMGLEGYPLDRLDDIEGDFKGYISWLRTRPELVFNEAGLVVKKIYPNGDEYTFEYNEAGLKVKTIYPDGMAIMNEYNEAGLMVKEICSGSGAEYVFEYNEAGQKVKEIDPDGSEWNFEYNEAGHLVKLTRPHGSEVCYECNDAGLIVKEIWSDGGEWNFEYINDTDGVRVIEDGNQVLFVPAF